MKFYKRFPGDIGIKTGHLTMAEFGAYDRLLDHYYATECPLPANRCYGIARALTAADRAAVDRVLGEFFVLTGAGWEQQRAEEVIAEALPRIEAARENGKKGGRPRKEKPTGFSNETQDGTKGDYFQKTSHKPDTSSSLRSSEVGAAKRGSRLPADWELPHDWANFAREERPDLDPLQTAKRFADFWHGKTGQGATKMDWLATWRNWVRNERAPRPPPGSRPLSSAEMRVMQAVPNLAAPHLREGHEFTPELETFDVTPRALG